jgi:hypothetical protein
LIDLCRRGPRERSDGEQQNATWRAAPHVQECPYERLTNNRRPANIGTSIMTMISSHARQLPKFSV